MSRYERQQAGLTRKRPHSAPRRRRRKGSTLQKNKSSTKKKKPTTVSSSVHQQRKKRQKDAQLKKIKKKRESLTTHRTLKITTDSLSQSHLLRRTFLDQVRKYTKADRAGFWVYAPDNETLWTDDRNSTAKITIPRDSGVAGKCFISGEALLIHDVYKYPLFNPKIDKQTGYTTKNMLTIPIHGSEDDTTHVNLGVLQVVNKKARSGKFDVKDATLMQLLISILRAYISTMTKPLPDEDFTHSDLLEEGLPQLSLALNVMMSCVKTLDTFMLKDRFVSLRKEHSKKFNRKEAAKKIILRKETKVQKAWSRLQKKNVDSIKIKNSKTKSFGWNQLLGNNTNKNLRCSSRRALSDDTGAQNVTDFGAAGLIMEDDDSGEEYITGAQNHFESRSHLNGFDSPGFKDERRAAHF